MSLNLKAPKKQRKQKTKATNQPTAYDWQEKIRDADDSENDDTSTKVEKVCSPMAFMGASSQCETSL